MVVSTSLAMEESNAESDMFERVSWANDAFGSMRRLLDDELQRHVRLVVQVAKECNGRARYRGIDVLGVEKTLSFVEDSLILVLEFDEQGGFETGVFCGKRDGRRRGLDESARSGGPRWVKRLLTSGRHGFGCLVFHPVGLCTFSPSQVSARQYISMAGLQSADQRKMRTARRWQLKERRRLRRNELHVCQERFPESIG